MKIKLQCLKNRNFAAIGIGAMIVFIAMVLVAGIAASVLIQTAGSLERKGKEIGVQTTGEVATGIKVTDIEGQYGERTMGYNTTTGIIWGLNNSKQNAAEDWDPHLGWHNCSRIHNMTITITPRAGSIGMDLNNAVLEISNSTTKCMLTFDGTQFQSTVGGNGLFSTNAFNLKPNNFGIIVIEDYDNSVTSTSPVLNRGDRVMLTVNASACFWGLDTSTNVWGNVIVEEGNSAVFSFRTPASLSDTIYDLF